MFPSPHLLLPILFGLVLSCAVTLDEPDIRPDRAISMNTDVGIEPTDARSGGEDVGLDLGEGVELDVGEGVELDVGEDVELDVGVDSALDASDGQILVGLNDVSFELEPDAIVAVMDASLLDLGRAPDVQMMCNARTESCDGIDNDCDGQVDEDFPELNTRCIVGTGTCRSIALFSCDANGDMVCPVEARQPQDEICDGRDNDCDGRMDEDFPTLGETCSVGNGTCTRPGTFICGDDGKTLCDGTPGESLPEGGRISSRCDGLDNDCDGMVDEGYDVNCCRPSPNCPRANCWNPICVRIP